MKILFLPAQISQIPYNHVTYSLLLSTDVDYLPWKSKKSPFEACIGCDTFGKAFFAGFVWAHSQHLGSVILKEPDPILNPFLFSSAPVFSFSFPCIYSFPHYPICPPIFSHASLPSASPCPAIHYCSLWRIPGDSLSSSIPSGRRYEATKSSVVGAMFVCVLIHSHLIFHNGNDHHSPISSVIRLTAQGPADQNVFQKAFCSLVSCFCSCGFIV